MPPLPPHPGLQPGLKNAEYIRSGGTGVSAGFQPRRSLEPTKSGYATVLTGSKLQWGKKSPPEAKTQLNTSGFMPEEIRIKDFLFCSGKERPWQSIVITTLITISMSSLVFMKSTRIRVYRWQWLRVKVTWAISPAAVMRSPKPEPFIPELINAPFVVKKSTPSGLNQVNERVTIRTGSESEVFKPLLAGSVIMSNPRPLCLRVLSFSGGLPSPTEAKNS